MDDVDLYKLVGQAQLGDVQALNKIIDMYDPVIKKAKRKMNRQEQDDLEQSIIETITYKILTYDLSRTPSFTDFFALLEKPERGI